MTPEILAHDIAWEASGHLSEIALSVAADGEYTLLDGAMSRHLASCEACSAQLGLVALRSADVSDALAARTAAPAHEVSAAPAQPVITAAEPPVMTPARGPASVPVRRKVPFFAVAAALAVALLGALPFLLSVPDRLTHTLSVARKVAPSFLRIVPEVANRAWDGWSAARLVVTWSLAAVLLAMGVAIAKKASKKMILDGGRQ